MEDFRKKIKRCKYFNTQRYILINIMMHEYFVNIYMNILYLYMW